MTLQRGFIYTVRNPPFTFEKTKVIKEFERMSKEVTGEKIILTDRQAFLKAILIGNIVMVVLLLIIVFKLNGWL